jgi:aspartyl-tRNA(Asn)/glutamyl-tRNA(Gln) amidotransferase subunit C
MITREEVEKIAHLAKLNFSDNKMGDLAKELTRIMDMIDSLNSVDCSDVKPLSSVCDMSQRFREDEVTSSDISDELFRNAPGKDGVLAKEIKCFIVPKMVE